MVSSAETKQNVSGRKNKKATPQAAKEEQLSGKETEESGGNGEEDSSELEESDDDDVPALEENDAAKAGAGTGAPGEANLTGDNVQLAGKQSRGEKKARKTLMKVCN